MVDLDSAEAEGTARKLMQTIPLHRWTTATKTLIAGAILVAIGVLILAKIEPQIDSGKVAVAVTILVLGIATVIFALILMAEIPFRKKRLTKMLTGERLAHWTYSSAEWEQYRKYQEMQRDASFVLNESMFISCTIVATIFGGIAYLATRRWEDHRIATVSIAFACGFVCCLIANFIEWISWVRWCKRLKNRSGETLISKHGVYFHSVFYSWESFGSRLTSLELVDDAPIPVLRFVIAFRTKNGEHERTLEVPVPQDEDVSIVLEHLA